MVARYENKVIYAILIAVCLAFGWWYDHHRLSSDLLKARAEAGELESFVERLLATREVPLNDLQNHIKQRLGDLTESGSFEAHTVERITDSED